nr:kelch protein 18 [Hymenolepis microstoma]
MSANSKLLRVQGMDEFIVHIYRIMHLVESVIDFVYTGKIDIDVGNVGQLYLLAHQLGSQSLIDGCRNFIEKRFGQINFNEIWIISSILGKHYSREKCIHTIASDFDSFVKNQKCLRWTTAKDMEALLSSPWLWAPSEDLRFKAVVSWINAAPSSCERDTRDAFFTHLLSMLNVNKIPRSFIVEAVLEESDIILSHKSRHALLDYSRTCHKSGKEGKNIFYGENNVTHFLTPMPKVKDKEPVFEIPYREESCTVACDEYIYVIGGMTKEMRICTSALKVNICNGDVERTKSMTQSRRFASAVTVEHEILVFGGCYELAVLNTCEKYSPSKNEWVKLPNMPTGRIETGAVHVPELGVLVLGGNAELGGNNLRTVELFQCSANNPTWISFTPMLLPRSYPAVEFFKGCVYVAGSLWTNTHTAEFLPITDGVPDQWTLIPHCDSIRG